MSYQPVVNDLPESSRTYRDTGLDSETMYGYEVQAVGPGGLSDWSEMVVAETGEASLLAAPTDLTATATSTTEIDVSWSHEGGSGITYELQRREGTEGTWATIADKLASQTYPDSGLTPGTTYYYRVRATDGEDVSDWSSEASATTESPQTLSVYLGSLPVSALYLGSKPITSLK